jgi:hypothetical protein
MYLITPLEINVIIIEVVTIHLSYWLICQRQYSIVIAILLALFAQLIGYDHNI